jgi:hypothetical protein
MLKSVYNDKSSRRLNDKYLELFSVSILNGIIFSRETC